jgi:TPR repeat protein
MGDTFNPHRLKERRVYGGVRPDVVEARRWYEQAREISPREASQRLQELEIFGNGS